MTTKGNRAQPLPVLTVDRECRLGNAPPGLAAAIRAELTIDNPKYQAAKQFGRWIGKKIKPQLFFYREAEACLFFPRGFGNQAAEPGFGPTRAAAAVELERDAFELAALVTKLRDAAADVERKANGREAYDELDDVRPRERYRT